MRSRQSWRLAIAHQTLSIACSTALGPAQAAAAPQVGQREVGEDRPVIGVRHIHTPALRARRRSRP